MHDMDHHMNNMMIHFFFLYERRKIMYESIRVAQFGTGSQKELELLASMDCPKDLIIIVLTHDTDRLYIISHEKCEEIIGTCRTLIEGGMFPNITGNITPRFKLMRVDVPTILASSAKIAEQMKMEADSKNIELNKKETKKSSMKLSDKKISSKVKETKPTQKKKSTKKSAD